MHPAITCIHDHLAALNAGNEEALAATLLFPHYRFIGTEVKIWDTPGSYLADFHARAGQKWARSNWGEIVVLEDDERQAHLHLRVDRYDQAGSLICSFWSVWCVVASEDGWKVQARLSMAPK